MTVDELIGCLEEYREELGDDAELRLMTQPNWPLEYAILGLASRQEIDDYDDQRCGAENDEGTNEANILYVVEGQQLSYGSTAAWHVAS